MGVSTHSETNLQKNIALFVTKEPHCLKEILSAKRTLRGKISVIVGTKKHLAHLLKKQKFRLSLLMREAKKRLKRNCLKFVKSLKLI